MKRFLICMVTLLTVAVGGSYLVLSRGFYLDLEPGAPVSVPFCAQEKKLMVQQEDGTYAHIELRGVELSASMPGAYASSFAPEEEDYLRWLEQIAQMGANVVRVATIMDDHFYNAFYRFNVEREEPVYLLQGIQVSDAANRGGEDAYHDTFLGRLLEDGVAVVDVIHGRKISTVGQTQGSGTYLRDISPWVLGYLVGSEWDADTIAYTDHSSIRSGAYEGEYFSTTADATPFEAALAQVMERMISYERNKYRTQRPIGFVSAPDIDFLVYEENYTRQLSKYAWVNAEHVIPSEQAEGGYFAAYQLYDFCDGFLTYLSDEQTLQLAEYIPLVDTGDVYSGYLDLLGAYHTMPVIVSSCGFSSARGAVDMDKTPLTEQEQGEALMEVWQDAVDAGWAGGFISTWQDVWERRTWNTAFATELPQNYLWHDLQSEGQNYGLMAYAPGEEPVCVLDGNPEEWMGDAPVLEWKDTALYLRYDEEGLYLLIQGDGAAQENTLYLPLDMTEELGSTRCAEPEVAFDRAADFLLCLDGTHNTRLLVQERYDAMRENFLAEITGENPFVHFPEKDSARFVPVSMALANDTLIEGGYNTYTADELWKLRGLGVWETGRLIHGNGDPDAANYNSLADFCYGRDCVELRLPWLLLNVADPTSMLVHQDYYTNYGVMSKTTPTIYLGLGDGATEIAFEAIDTRNWDWDLDWRERLKQSYHVVKAYWSDE